MKLFHVADLHLGRRRLGGRLPDQDFADAFRFIAAKAIEEKAAAFLISGDLFDRPQVEPPHLRQAQQILRCLKQAQIPVIAIEGNHDKAFIHSDAPTWLQYLSEDELLILLHTRFDHNGAQLVPWQNPHTGGAWIDFHGVRFVGAGYLGAATPHKVRDIAARLEPGPAHVLLLHAGPDYFTGEGGGFSKQDLRAIQQKVCYLALGHIHKPMLHGHWACNPGSPENCDLREANHPEPRGFAVVEIEPGRNQAPVRIEIRSNPRRPCHSLTLDCTPFGNKLKHGAVALVDAGVDLIQAHQPTPDAIIHLRLTGSLNLERIALDQETAGAEIERAAKVAAVSFDTSGLNVNRELAAQTPLLANNLSHEELERRAISNLVETENLWGLEGRQNDFADLIYHLKEQVRSGKTAEELAELLSQNPLVVSIKQALHELSLREPRAERDHWKETGQSAVRGFDLVRQVAEALPGPAKN